MLLVSVHNLQKEAQKNEVFQAFMEKIWILIAILYFLARFPMYSWTICEGKRVEYICEELNKEHKDADYRKKAITRAARFILQFNQSDRFYIKTYIWWNLMSVLSSAISIAVIDRFIDGHFLTLGFNVSGIKTVFPLEGTCAKRCTTTLGFTHDEVVVFCQLHINKFAQVALPALW